MGKGSNFEREVCKRLSLWWTELETKPRDDVFWRSSISGGRATVRAKTGKSTFGSYGDIAAVDPIGLPLLKLVTIELKRGYSKHSPGELFDSTKFQKSPFSEAVQQAERCARLAGSFGWMLIHRRDRKAAIAYFSTNVVKLLQAWGVFSRPPVVRYSLIIMPGRKWVRFVGIPFDSFLSRINARQICDLVRSL